MLNFFKHSFLSQQIVIVAMAIVLWLPAFIMEPAFIKGEGYAPLYNVIISILDFSPFLVNALAFIVCLVCIFLFNSILSANRLVSKYSTVGALAFVLMMCGSPEPHSTYPFILACPYILMAMHTLFLVHQTDTPENYMMNIGCFIAIASLFYYPAAFLIVWVLMSFLVLGFKTIRHLMIPLVGFLVINALVLGISFLLGNAEALLGVYSSYYRSLTFSFEMSSANMIFVLVTTILFLISIIRISSNRNTDRSSNMRKKIGVAMVLTLFSIIIMLVHKPLIGNALIFMMYAFFYSIVLSDIKKSRIVNVIIIVMILYIIANRYLPLFDMTI